MNAFLQIAARVAMMAVQLAVRVLVFASRLVISFFVNVMRNVFKG